MHSTRRLHFQQTQAASGGAPAPAMMSVRLHRGLSAGQHALTRSTVFWGQSGSDASIVSQEEIANTGLPDTVCWGASASKPDLIINPNTSPLVTDILTT